MTHTVVLALAAPPVKKSCMYQEGMCLCSKKHSGDDIHCSESPIRTTTEQELCISKRNVYFAKMHRCDDVHCRESHIRTTTAKELYIPKRNVLC